MFSINTVYLRNFKSYAGEHEFELPTEPGLYFLTGDNQDEPSLGSNGAGKSTLLDAIYWCLYERTLRGLKAGDVVTWGETGCTVSVDLNVAGTEMTVTRTQNPNNLTIEWGAEGLTIDQAALLKHIVLGPDAFVYSVILPQFGQSFFASKPADKLALFSQIMNLDFWLDKSQKAASVSKEIEKQIIQTTSAIQSTKDAIVSVTSDVAEFTKKESVFEDERDKAMGLIEAKANRLDEGLNQLDARKSKLTEIYNFITKELAERQDAINQINKAKLKHLERRDQIKLQHGVLKNRIREQTLTIDRLDEIDAECPTCLQIVSPAHLKLEKKKLLIVIEGMQTKLKQLDVQLNEVQKFVAKTEADGNRLATIINDATTEYQEISSKLAAIAERYKAIEEQASELTKDLKTKENEQNPYTSMLKERSEKLRKLEAKLADQQEQLATSNAEFEATNYWVNGFKRIRLFIIEETLRTLELEVNNNLASLGLTDWQVEFDVERENKSGGVTKGFTVFIRCPSNPEPVRWESWSGGETQRLQLAGDFGLANLIMTQAGLRNAIEFYDEPSNHLSDEGLTDLAETLYQRAGNDKKVIFLVDHRMPDFGEFTGVYHVIKDKHGSRIKKAP